MSKGVLLHSLNNRVLLNHQNIVSASISSEEYNGDSIEPYDEAELQIFDKIGDTFKKGKEWFDRQPTGVKIGVISGGVVAGPALIGYTHNFVAGVGAGIVSPVAVPMASLMGGSAAVALTTLPAAALGPLAVGGSTAPVIGGALVGVGLGGVVALIPSNGIN